MADNMDVSELAEIIGDIPHSEESSREYYRTFKPWHHPRKQWVRAKHWCKHTEKLIRKLKGNHRFSCLSYLTLPGDDLLDIREIHKVCLKHEIELRYLGFNTATNKLSEDPLSINHHEMMGKHYVNNESRIERERLELIANNASVANKRFESYGPFDVVNIDLCNSVAVHSNRPNDVSYFDMLLKLLESQFNKKHTPWLLFMSTTVSVPEINPDVVCKFINITKENIDSSDTFKSELLTALNEEPENLASVLSSAFDSDSDQMISLFGISFCKWVIHICLNAQPHWLFNIEDVCCYTVQANRSTLMSLALKFEKSTATISDPNGLAKTDIPEFDNLDEVQLAILALQKISSRVDVDLLLSENQDIFDNMKKASSQLLEEARYSVDEYEAWIMDQV